jgi:hypothetical protein
MPDCSNSFTSNTVLRYSRIKPPQSLMSGAAKSCDLVKCASQAGFGNEGLPRGPLVSRNSTDVVHSALLHPTHLLSSRIIESSLVHFARVRPYTLQTSK